jgi:hypothetical protein
MYGYTHLARRWVVVCMLVSCRYYRDCVFAAWLSMELATVIYARFLSRLVEGCVRCTRPFAVVADAVIGCEAEWRRRLRLHRKRARMWKGKADVHQDKPGSLGRPRRLAGPPQHPTSRPRTFHAHVGALPPCCSCAWLSTLPRELVCPK